MNPKPDFNNVDSTPSTRGLRQRISSRQHGTRGLAKNHLVIDAIDSHESEYSYEEYMCDRLNKYLCDLRSLHSDLQRLSKRPILDVRKILRRLPSREAPHSRRIHTSRTRNVPGPTPTLKEATTAHAASHGRLTPPPNFAVLDMFHLQKAVGQPKPRKGHVARGLQLQGNLKPQPAHGLHITTHRARGGGTSTRNLVTSKEKFHWLSPYANHIFPVTKTKSPPRPGCRSNKLLHLPA